ncbi:hypothetical protein CL631_00635 [bacterium]|nr:hypothetical protein [bacterium]|tara:strand:+ start:3956 stop:6283 length:2328 start_codon:yes stop_codon:yes gene_type:complete
MMKSLSWLQQSLVLATAFLLPVIFIPILSAPFQFTKSLILVAIVLVSFAIWIVTQLKVGSITIPKSLILLGGALIPFVYFLSSLFSENVSQSLFGTGIEVDTFLFMLVFYLLMVLTAVSLQTERHFVNLYWSVLAVFGVLVIYQGLRVVFGSDFLSFGILTAPTSNLVGKWNDLSVFFGLSALLLTISLEQLKMALKMRIGFWALLVISLFFLILINFSTVWVVLGLFSLAIATLNFFADRVRGEGSGAPKIKNLKAPSLAVLVVSAIFVFAGSGITGALSTSLGIGQIEARPSWGTTFEIAKSTFSENALLGAGPNQFVGEWLKSKSSAVNTTIFWNVDFNAGVGSIPTSVITTGILGLLSWIIFLGIFALSGSAAAIMRHSDDLVKYFMISSVVIASYLWVITIVYVPNMVLIAYAFLFTGVFVAVQQHARLIGKRTFLFSTKPRLGFVAILVLVVFLLGSGALLYSTSIKYASVIYIQKSAVSANVEGNIEKAKKNIERAIALNGSDRAERAAVNVGLLELQAIANEGLENQEVLGRFQNALTEVVGHGISATQADPVNYQNWTALGQVYEALVPLNVEGAYENAKGSYERARDLNPQGPEQRLLLARLEVLRGNNEEARGFIAESLQLKNNYTEAIFLLSQLEVNDGNIPGAIESVEALSFLSPGDTTIFFQLGLLRYNVSNFTGAIESLERAVELNNVYSNARYFLGLSYDRLGRKSEALEQFKLIEELNPENEEIKAIIKNLEAEEPALFDLVPPLPAPENRETPPIEE